jgi:hypothetical protein
MAPSRYEFPSCIFNLNFFSHFLDKVVSDFSIDRKLFAYYIMTAHYATSELIDTKHEIILFVRDDQTLPVIKKGLLASNFKLEEIDWSCNIGNLFCVTYN